ncbi:MAG TPA: hypothetical protein VH143_18205 [Kofleriaceae bacterium]|nr:hypothetical protein [Kofleriaceae bacterium]
MIVCWLVMACSAPAQRPAAGRPADTKAAECQPVNVYQTDFHEIEVYCKHVADGCCAATGQWGCNNVDYLEWYAAYCPH